VEKCGGQKGCGDEGDIRAWLQLLSGELCPISEEGELEVG
jgi:hypothetical protein